MARLTVPPQLNSDLASRMRWLMLVRVVVLTMVLGLTLWLWWFGDGSPSAPAWIVMSALIVATYGASIGLAVALRRGADPERLLWPQLIGDLVITSVIVLITGGTLSAYTFLYAISVVAGGVMMLRRGAVTTTLIAIALNAAVVVIARQHVEWLPMLPNVEPWAQATAEFGRSLSLSTIAILGVGVLSFMLGDQLQHTTASLASERQVIADLFTLHQDIIRSLTSGLVTVAPDWKTLTINDAAGEILGVNPLTTAEAPIEDILPGIVALAQSLAPGDSLRRADLTIPRAPQPLTLGISISPLRDVHNHIVGRVINFQDLTELRSMEEQFRRTERMATLGRVAAGVAHEIRNPLASISGSIELLKDTPQRTEDDKTLMTIVVREIDRLNELITELLAYASPRPREAVVFDLGDLAREIVFVLKQDRGNDGIGIELGRCEPALVRADSAQIRQVVWNLLRNAVDAVTGRQPATVTINVFAEGATHVVEVIDDGVGIPPDVVAHIFEPFFTTKSTGSGLGLAICHAIVTEHGGVIEVKSELGRGTKFRFSLPARRRDAASESTPAIIA